MDDPLLLTSQLLVSVLLGLVLGAGYFYALWVTIHHVPQARHPALLLLASAVLRLGMLFTGLYFVTASGHWERLLAAVAGIILARILLTRWLSIPSATPQRPEEADG
ncbi:ATP synthase subunit I [Thioalkalivibrio sp.]|uniref:N-ATPase subunit AtpR n=1 Tax=Thioalkalivibrio sp. TaxID=2093813 RepID=UPI0039771B85